MMGYSELRLNCIARRDAARPMRHAVAAFLAASGQVDRESSDDILTAVGEALANAVEHAYDGVVENEVELFAHLNRDNTLAVDVFDRGVFIERAPRPGRGFGMRIVEAIAKDVTVNIDNGTHVRMIFAVPPGPEDTTSN
jgi:anti-sigma regulatory factor (Ser/Thr protein kinase)